MRESARWAGRGHVKALYFFFGKGGEGGTMCTYFVNVVGDGWGDGAMPKGDTAPLGG